MTLSLSLECLICSQRINHNKRAIMIHLEIRHDMDLTQYAKRFKLSENKTLSRAVVRLKRLKKAEVAWDMATLECSRERSMSDNEKDKNSLEKDSQLLASNGAKFVCQVCGVTLSPKRAVIEG